ncbi:protein draper-like [Anneissia japonica]|uniref:protein draper-like n=1 Tax=Anneissia japonica TaxID=1529436 RepID=UPI0014259D28|nr:protein draper-like [Anneissia japonica]XP_033112365.1 protein draper-like [Anneissia japonica]XP_033112366.1 protein draper-like [Anneissia japonica]
MELYCVWFLIAMEIVVINAQLSPSDPHTCQDSENGLWRCCDGYDQVGYACVEWKCSNELQCYRGNCNTNTGKCDCPPGWEGTKCELPCELGKYGQNCIYECNCNNGAECEPVNGNCVCLPGFIGDTCETPCPSGTFGKYCRKNCDCLNNAPCDSVDGTCMCNRGFTGDRCEKCIPKNHLMQCFDFCSTGVCMNGAICDTVTKQCMCSPGYSGEHCTVCNPITHTGNCIKDCENTLCANGATCDTDTNQCKCTPGWQRRSCNTPCDNNFYGRDCKQKCSCESLQCHHVTGECLSECPMGWMGEDCRQPCIEGFYGYKCNQVCTCQNGAQCDPETGVCLCLVGFRGENCEEECPPTRSGINCVKCSCESPLTCNDEFNECVCPAGFMGVDCQQPCPEGYYGPNCYKQCSCPGNMSCDGVSGECNCEPGWTGMACALMCPQTTFGRRCQLPCPECPDRNGCFHTNGSCDMCDPGFKGESCDVPCPEGLYGPNCMYTCSCSDDEMCNPINGACPQPYSQSPSTVVLKYVLEEKDNDFPLFIVISASTLSFLLILMLTILIGTRIYQKGYKHGSRSSHHAQIDVVSMNSVNGNGGPQNGRVTIQTFNSSDSGLGEFSTHLQVEGATPDIIASNSTSNPLDLDDSSYTEVEINLCPSTSTFNEYQFTTPPALPAQNPCHMPVCNEKESKIDDLYDEAYSSIEKEEKKDDSDGFNCYDFLDEAQTLPSEPAKPKPVAEHQYYVLEPTPPEDEDDYDSISDEETAVCLPVPNNYEDITINTAGPSQIYEEVKSPLVRHHTLDVIGKNKRHVYDQLGHSAKRWKRMGSEGSRLAKSNGDYGRLQQEVKDQAGYNELEFGPRKVRVGETVFPTGNYYGSLSR